RHRGRDHYRIDLRIVDQFVRIATRRESRVEFAQRRETLLAQIANTRDRRSGRGHKVSHEVRAPVAVADYTNSDHLFLRTSPITRAGTPATIAKSGTSFVTTAPAPIKALSPIVMPAMIVALLPILARRFTVVFTTCQSLSVCGVPSTLTALG